MHQFPNLVAGIRDWEEQQPKKTCYYYFLDYLAVDQHNPYEDLGSMGSLVRYCDVFLLVLSPWPTPILLSRVVSQHYQVFWRGHVILSRLAKSKINYIGQNFWIGKFNL